MARKASYSAKDIKALTDREHLTSRMSLVFGPVEPMGVTYSYQKGTCLREIVDNSVDECLRGYAHNVSIKFFADRSVEVSDDGRGIPVDIGTNAQGDNVSGIVLCLGTLRAGSNFANNSTFSTGTNGLGAAASVFCSKRADITVYRNNKQHSLSFQDGTPGFFDDSSTDGVPHPDNPFAPLEDLTYLKVTKCTSKRPDGTTVRLWLDDSVFSSPYPYSSKELIARFKKTCYLVPGLRGEVYSELDSFIDADGNEKPYTAVFEFDDGLRDLVRDIQPDNQLCEPLLVSTKGTYEIRGAGGSITKKPVEVSVALSYGEKYDYTLQSFVNTIHTQLGGILEVGFERALRDAINSRITKGQLVRKNDDMPIVDDYQEGLTAVVSVSTPEPIFTSQSKEALSGAELQKCLLNLLTEAFSQWAGKSENADVLNTIVSKVTIASHNRQRARAQRELDRKKNKIVSSGAPDALLECETYGTEESEMIICEGISAATSLKGARDSRFSCILPIRGKITNAWKASEERLLENPDVQNIIQSIGTGVGKDFDISQAKVGKVLIGCDADPDGAAISVLIATLFRKLMPDWVKSGRLYKIETPLFVISTKEGGKSRKLYAKDDYEKESLVKHLDSKNVSYTISRLKGLGEAPSDVLYEFAFNPETRIIKQVSADDFEETDKVLDLLFSTDTAKRKQWIETYQGSFNDVEE